MKSKFSYAVVLTGLLLFTLPATSALAAGSRTVTCQMREVPNVTAVVLIEDDNGQDVLKSIAIADSTDPSVNFDQTIGGTITEKNVTTTSLYKDSTFLQEMFTAYFSNYDSIDLFLAKDGTKTAEEILHSISDDAAGIFYAEAHTGGKMTDGILLVGWGGFYVGCR